MPPLPEKRGPVFPFGDVAQDRWSYPYVKTLTDRGIVHGVSETAFAPEGQLTRGQLVTLLGRMAGVRPADYPHCAFTDVADDAYWAPYIEWAAENHVTAGTSKTTFSPDINCTRGQIVTFLYRDMK